MFSILAIPTVGAAMIAKAAARAVTMKVMIRIFCWMVIVLFVERMCV